MICFFPGASLIELCSVVAEDERKAPKTASWLAVSRTVEVDIGAEVRSFDTVFLSLTLASSWNLYAFLKTSMASG